MIKKSLVIIGILLVAAMLFYFFPVISPSFETIYRDVDDKTRQSLQTFRKDFPPTQIEYQGITWKYLSVGEGNETILFLHGMTGAYDIWWQQILELKGNYKIISVTYPLIGNLKEIGDGIDKILKSENIKSVNVVGSSLGGYLAQYLITSHPTMIKKAIFGNTYPPGELKIDIDKKKGKLLPIVPEWLLMHLLRKQTKAEIYPTAGYSEIVKAYIFEQSYGKMSKELFRARFYCVIDPFIAPNIKTLDIPVLILESENDPLIELQFREMLKNVYPSAEVKTLQKVGHFPYLNEPKIYSDIIRHFFSQG